MGINRFREMARGKEDSDPLELRQKATIVFCFVVFVCYAEVITVTLCFNQYIAAVSFFKIYLLPMVLQCFEIVVLGVARSKNGWRARKWLLDRFGMNREGGGRVPVGGSVGAVIVEWGLGRGNSVRNPYAIS